MLRKRNQSSSEGAPRISTPGAHVDSVGWKLEPELPGGQGEKDRCIWQMAVIMGGGNVPAPLNGPSPVDV